MPDVDLLISSLGRGLLEARLIASLATHNADGTMHVVPIWFLWDGEAVLMPTSGASRKARNASRDERAAVMLHDSRGGLDICGMTMTGRVEVQAGVATTIARIHRKYVTEEGLALAEVREALGSDDVILRFVPQHAASWDLRNHPASQIVLERGAFEPLLPVHSKPAP